MLVVDNYDSFVHTLDAYLRELGADTNLVRNDDIPLAEVAEAVAGYDGILVSPGPGVPADAGISRAAVRAALASGIPLLGVCLGHQAIAEELGARVDHAPELMHGMVSEIAHDGTGVFAGMPERFRATRYHSLAIVDGTLPDELEVTARTPGGVIMGVRHRAAAVEGVQFHPESVLTEGGYLLLANWLEQLGLSGAAERAQSMTPLVAAQPEQ